MAETEQQALEDHRLEQLLGLVLRIGVLVSAAVVLLGGILFIPAHLHWIPSYSVFTGAREQLRSVPGTVHGVLGFQPDALVQLGFVLLIATPMLRVVFSLFGFVQRKDWLYTVVSLIVTGVLVAGLFGK